ncbi:MAG: NACHT domain-containing protein [Saprospiraceae bacterium]|nr:NACHT domain-containing protein [Saprospiraceae bacterium]
MNRIEKYIDAVALYYSSIKRPYSEFGNPLQEFGILSPDSVLKLKSRILLYGMAGSGKTTCLDWIASYAATTKGWVPIFVSLRNYGSTLEDLLQVSIRRFDKEIRLEDIITNSLVNLQPVLLFDGFDEVPAPFQKEVEISILKFANSFPNASIVVTSRYRPESDDWSEWRILNIPILTIEQIHNYLSIIMDKTPLLDKLMKSPQFIELASRPVFLYTFRNAWYQRLDFRDYLMREVPLYTAWRGHTKSRISLNVSHSLIDKVLISLALKSAILNIRNFKKKYIQEAVQNALIKNSEFKLYLDAIPLIDVIIDAIIGTDVIISNDLDVFSFSHISYLESYAARGLHESIRLSLPIETELKAILQSKFASEIVRYFFSILDENELNYLANQLSFDLLNNLSKLGIDIIADRLSEIIDKPASEFQQIINASIIANKFLLNQSRSRKDILVLSVHGFNTRGDWKNRLGFELTKATDGERFLYRAWDYGEFRIGILLPWKRSRQVEKFQYFYNNLISQFSVKPEICVVAHSFGTYIVAKAFRRFPELRFDRALFLGSPLPRKFRWANTKNRIGKMLNLIGCSDIALRIAYFIPGLGIAGRKGFLKAPEWLVQESVDFAEHSDLFGDEYMRLVWIPFIRDGSTPSE